MDYGLLTTMPPGLRNILRGFSNLRPSAGLSRPDSVAFDPMTLDDLTVHCRATWPTDLAAWDALSRRLPTATPFHAPAWQIAGWTAGRIRGRLRFITVQRGDDLVAALPLCLNPAGGLHSPGASLCDYLDPLIVPQSEPACWRAILAFVAAHWDRQLAEFTLHNNRASAACRSLLPPLAQAAGFSCEETRVDDAPAIPLPQSWEAFLDSLEAHERKELRRKLNKAQTKGEARLVRAEDASLLDQALHTMEAAGGEKGAAVRGYVRPLLEAVAPALLGDGRLELWTLQIQGRPAAYLIQLAGPDGPMLYNLGYEASMKEWSPGVVAVGLSIRQAIERGAKVFDLLRGREPYKHKLGAMDRPVYRITLKRTHA
jgi:CelD/BcsL family acetyltransferase involved in cellulose biosynthesis